MTVRRCEITVRMLCLTVAASALGCGAGAPLDRVPVVGEVTCDGRPLPYGTILFVPAEGSAGPKAGGIIRDGRFSIAVADGPIAGALRVEIRAPRLAAGTVVPDDATERLHLIARSAELLPARYHARSELKVDATRAGPHRFDFALTTDGR